MVGGSSQAGKVNVCILYLVFSSPSIWLAAISDFSLGEHREREEKTMVESFPLPSAVVDLACTLWI